MAGQLPKHYWTQQGNIQCVVDTTWGDGGKGKVVDSAASFFDVVVRYGGGPNAGHTVYRGKEAYKLHGIPSGIFYPKTISVVAGSVIINPLSLVEEIKELQKKGIKITPKNLLIDTNIHLIMPWHQVRDGLAEVARGGGKIGTTGKGIGPTYSDRTLRTGLQMKNLLNVSRLKNIFDEEYTWQNKLIHTMYTKATLEKKENIWKELLKARKILLPFIGNSLELLWSYEKKGKKILGEGAQGALLDLDLGSYPFVTSSNPGVVGFMKATALFDIGRVIGVTKAYATRVGSGPMPTELFDSTGEMIREKGGEFGATTGRPRRCGWLDAVVVRYGAKISGSNALAITKLDILDGMPEVKICVGYKVDGKVYSEMMTSDAEWMAKVQPVYETLPGWTKPTKGIKNFADLPTEAKKYLKRIEELVGLPIDIISVGPGRDDAIYR